MRSLERVALTKDSPTTAKFIVHKVDGKNITDFKTLWPER
jgi:hypothetical protein